MVEPDFRYLLDRAGEECYLYLPDGHFVYVNEAAARSLGYTVPDLLHLTFSDINPQYPPSVLHEFIETVCQRELPPMEMIHRTRDGRLVPKELKTICLTMHGQQYLCTFGHEITARKEAEARLRHTNRALLVLSAVNQALVRATDQAQLFAAICNTVTNVGGYRFVWIGLTDLEAQQIVHPVAWAGEERGYLQDIQIRWAADAMPATPTGDAIRYRHPIIVDDITAATDYTEVRMQLLARGCASAAALPLINNDQVLGNISIYASTPNAFAADEVPLLQELAADLAYGIISLQARASAEQAEVALRESEVRYRGLFEHMGETGIIGEMTYDDQGHACDWLITQANAAFLARSSLPADQVIGHPASEVYGREEVERLLPCFGPVVETRTATRFEYHSGPLHQDFLVSAFPLTDACFVVIATDVSELREAKQTAERERAFLSSAIDLLPFPVFFVAPDNGTIRNNLADREFLARHSVHAWSEVELLRPGSRSPVSFQDRPVQRALRGERVENLEGIVRFPDGAEVPILVHAAPIYVDTHLVAGVVAIQNITALKEADEAKNRFLAILSHELRTPLTNILGWVKEAQTSPELVPEALDIIRRNAESQHHMLEDLLDASRLLHGKLILRQVPADLWEIAQPVIDSARDRAAQRLVTVEAVPPDTPLPIMADIARMRQAIEDLLDNARAFTTAGDTITVTSGREGNNAVLTVHDTGLGIPAEVLPRLFSLFRQVERAEQAGGLGLGLMLVRGIVELHGGTVSVASAGRGQGSTFTIMLPLRAGA